MFQQLLPKIRNVQWLHVVDAAAAPAAAASAKAKDKKQCAAGRTLQKDKKEHSKMFNRQAENHV